MSENNGFIGYNCPVCGEAFKDGDDIVTCPECGTPHHRACWFKDNRCANAHRHAAGYVFTPAGTPSSNETAKPHVPTPQDIDGDDERTREFQAMLEDMNAYNASQDIPPAEKERLSAQSINGVSELELMNFFGSNQFYFILLFKNMAKTGRKLNINIFAALLTPFYQFYRRMNFTGVIIAAVQFLLNLPTLIYYLSYTGMFRAVADTIQSGSSQLIQLSTILSYVSFAVTLIMLLLNDFIYYLWTTNKIKSLRARCEGMPENEYYEKLAACGKPSLIRSVIAMLLCAFLEIIFGIVIMRMVYGV